MAIPVTATHGTGLLAAAPQAITIGAASGLVLARNLARKGAVFVNASGNRISFGIGSAAVLDSGITIYGNGGTWMMNEHAFTTDAVYGIASAAGSNLAVQEFT